MTFISISQFGQQGPSSGYLNIDVSWNFYHRLDAIDASLNRVDSRHCTRLENRVTLITHLSTPLFRSSRFSRRCIFKTVDCLRWNNTFSRQIEKRWLFFFLFSNIIEPFYPRRIAKNNHVPRKNYQSNFVTYKFNEKNMWTESLSDEKWKSATRIFNLRTRRKTHITRTLLKRIFFRRGVGDATAYWITVLYFPRTHWLLQE